ncbi:MAG: hypothetical protein LQ338_003508, partial [Usnochroma carphineum]
VSLSQIRWLSLPISNGIPIAAIVLPVLTVIGIRGAQSALTGSDDSVLKRRSLPSWVIPAVFVFLVVYDTVIATLSITQMLPSDVLTCQLSERWLALWEAHDSNAIRRIQDARQCCGFRSTKNMAWPFDGDQGVATCSHTYRRERSCLPAWRRDLQINAGLILLVAVGTFSVKVIVLMLYRDRAPLTQHVRRGYTALTAGEEDVEDSHQGNERPRGQGRIEAPYSDDIPSNAGLEDADTERDGQVQTGSGAQRQDSNGVLQPSNMQGQANEWRS